MYSYQRKAIEDARTILETAYTASEPGATYVYADCGQSVMLSLENTGDRHVFNGLVAAFLQEMIRIAESQEREIEHITAELKAARTVGDEMARIIAENAMYPPGDPEPPF